MKHLLVAVSPHGFGHLAQVAPVINRLRQIKPDLKITLRTSLPRERLASRIMGDFELDPHADDFGMLQKNALEVDIEASGKAYQAFHQHWPQRVSASARALEAQAPDLILADVPYLTLAAAQQAQIPSMAMSVLNWVDIFWHYHHDMLGAARIRDEMLAAYHAAEVFLKTEPAMPMPDFRHTESIGPVALSGRNRRAAINDHCGLKGDEKLVLIGLGGIAMRLPVENWPHQPGVYYIVQRDWQVQRDDVIVIEDLVMPFSDILASSDVFITKPGYGSFTEAAVNGIPVLYVPRENWPEQPYLVDWLMAHAHALSISNASIMTGELARELEAVLAMGPSIPVLASGIETVCARVINRLAQ